MVKVQLPISKSIANRILLLQAIHGDPLMRVSSDMPDDVVVLHDALEKIREMYGTPSSGVSENGGELTLYLKNCGTALRFLQVHLARCYAGKSITLTGDHRLMERDGAPTTQTTSALLMHGESISVSDKESPYITMTRRLTENYRPNMADQLERDWSAAAFWYEYITIYGGELLLEGLTADSIQGDRVVAELYAVHFGVQTVFTKEGAVVRHQPSAVSHQPSVAIDFEHCPDLYPAIALTCERLGITLHAAGTERLRYKECDRIEAVRMHETRRDHRMAMALLVAGFPIDDIACIAKSYPTFFDQWSKM